MTKEIPISSLVIGGGNPIVLIAGPCVIESEAGLMQAAEQIVKAAESLKVPLVFKSSFDKANRSSIVSYRGPGLAEGLKLLAKVKETYKVPVISDVHEAAQVVPASEVLDALQVPAFLCRQTDLLTAAAKSGLPVSVKKGQFMAPWDVANIIRKFREAGSDDLMLTERGVSFGYNNLVVDYRSLAIMRPMGCPLIFDATHSVQLPGGAGSTSSGQREFVAPLSRAAAAVGIDGLFMEVHPCPDDALCDGANMVTVPEMVSIVEQVLAIDELLRG
jgi:2-dehydro-3-deoxyphosphooctonate aldolase (KDO 8-P synthase)